MSCLLLKIQSNHQQAELLSDTLMALGALSVSIEDAHAQTPHEQAIFAEPGDPPPTVWQNNIVTGMFETKTDIVAIIQSLKTQMSLSNIDYQLEHLHEQDWVRLTQAQFEPIRVSDDLWIVPSWQTAPNSQAINIILDPGLAFGTGSHPTTHLCLTWLTEQAALAEVLDYGCGSGILAIAAKKLGANKVVGVDIDTQAISASRYNAERNQAEIAFFDSADYLHDSYDVVVANILSSALMVLAPVLAKSCKMGGKIALSGILATQQAMLIAQYSTWFNIDKPYEKDGWVLLTGTKICP